jgi:serine/threonine protein kinase
MVIANCQIIERICTTAGSDLYRARRMTDGMAVLLKLAPEHANATQSALLLKREYRLLQSLDGTGIAKPLALVGERGAFALILEDFAGASLEVVLGRDLRLGLAGCLRIGRQLADTLAAIDAAQIIHRDIRTANILLDPEAGQVLLVDFSMATAQGASTVPAEEVAIPAGDWAYVSPEQTGRMNRPVDYRTDGYSTGVLLYRMLTAQLPFQASDPLEWAHCHIARMPAPPREIVPEQPQAVSDIVTKLLAKLPEDRYQSAHGLRADLDRCPGAMAGLGPDRAVSIPVYGRRRSARAHGSARGAQGDGVRPSRPFWRASPPPAVPVEQIVSVLASSPAQRWLARRLEQFEIPAKVVPVPSVQAGVQRVVDRQSNVFFGERSLLLAVANQSPARSDLTVLDRRFTYVPLAIGMAR